MRVLHIRLVVRTLLATLLSWQMTLPFASADDWPQWMGPQRDAVWRETGILERFPEQGAQIAWRQKVALGYAGPAVAQDRVFVMDYVTDGEFTPSAGQRNHLDGIERLLCFDADDGHLLWKKSEECHYHLSFPYGPRSTPTVDGAHVYTLGAEGNLTCRKVTDGSRVWQLNLPEKYHAKTPPWGYSCHPLVDGDRLICMAGGENSVVVALDKTTGREIWRALSAKEPGYSAPAIIHAGGTRQLLIWHAEALSSLDPATGKVYWSQPSQPDWGMAVTTPRYDAPYLFAGAIIFKSMLLELGADRPTSDIVWRSSKNVGISPVLATPFLEDGFLYGVDRRGELRCVELKTGEQRWTTYDATTTGRPVDNASAFLVKQGGRFFILNDSGQLVIAKMDPNGFKELSRAQVIEPTATAYGRKVLWSHPAFAHRSMYVRNDEEIICVSLAR